MNKPAEKWIEELREQADARMEEYVKNPSTWKKLPDESDQFISPEAGQILAEWRTGQFDFRSLFELSEEDQEDFLNCVKENWGIEIKIDKIKR